jgi:AraC-like DNA-binding protein
LIKKFFIFYTKKEKQNNSDKKLCNIIASNDQIKEYICSLYTTYYKRDLSPALIEVKLIEFLMLLAEQSENNEFISTLIQPVKKRNLKQFMDNNYLENLKVSDYASLTGRSVSTFNREFKNLYGTTPHKWLMQKRLDKSADYLKNTNMTVTEVALEVGYENVSHFIKAYKALFGTTPKRQRTQNSD